MTTRRAAAGRKAWSCPVRVVVPGPAALDEARAALTAGLAAADRACSRFRPEPGPAEREVAA